MTAAAGRFGVSRSIEVARTPEHVWSFVRDMGNWASQMPGYISHTSSSEDDSIWTLQVDIGPFKRPVAVDVCVQEWRGPHHVRFAIKGKHDPFVGAGSFNSKVTPAGTRIALDFSVTPTGSMARVLAPLIAPILDSVADQFSSNLRTALEPEHRGDRFPPARLRPAGTLWRSFTQWLRSLVRA